MTDLFDMVTSDAILSPCDECPDEASRKECTDPRHRPWRYQLRRTWDPSLPLLGWAMLNPSKATAVLSDPTINRCKGFTRQWGYGGFIVGNLYALRSTDPRELTVHLDPVGPENDEHLATIADEVAEIVCAWGAHPMAIERAAKVLRLLATHDHTPKCLGLTKGGQPKHPLYVKASAPLINLEF